MDAQNICAEEYYSSVLVFDRNGIKYVLSLPGAERTRDNHIRIINKEESRFRNFLLTYNEQIRVNNQQPVVSTISCGIGNVFNRSVKDVDFQRIEEYFSLARFYAGEQNIYNIRLNYALHYLKEATRAAEEAGEIITNWRNGCISGAGHAVTGLQFTRDISFGVVAGYATVVSGGTAGILISGGLAGTGELAEQISGRVIGIRQSISIAEVGVATVIGLVQATLGGPFKNSLVSRLKARNLSDRMAKELADIIVSFGSHTAEKLIKGITGRKTISEIMKDIFSSSALLLYVSGKIGGSLGEALGNFDLELDRFLNDLINEAFSSL